MYEEARQPDPVVYIPGPLSSFYAEDGTIPLTLTMEKNPVNNRTKRPFAPGCCIALLVLVLAVSAVLAAPASAQGPAAANSTVQAQPAVAYLGVYVVDFRRFSVEEGTVDTSFYLNIRSDTNLSLNDFELMNGQISSVSVTADTPGEKNYRIYAVLSTDPDLRRFPFDNHTLPIIFEPKTLDEKQLVIAVDRNQTGIYAGADMPGWELSGASQEVTNQSYAPDEAPYSRAVFSFAIVRDTASTFLKFFLPIGLIVLVSLASLTMKVTSRLGLNASMFLAAVLIHWRISDANPMVAYATFLDLFMIITYATLVMVLVSGILILVYNEQKDDARVNLVSRWSLRLIPAASAVMYALLFLSLLKW